jgi:hypothetical protein
MSEYVDFYSDGKKQISANVRKSRVYARFHGALPEPHFIQGQKVLDSTFAFLNGMKHPHIDYLLDVRFGLPFSERVLELWVHKAVETLTMYPKLNVVRISDDHSSLWQQLSSIQRLLDQYEGRIIGVFKTKEEADAYLDELRGYASG